MPPAVSDAFKLLVIEIEFLGAADGVTRLCYLIRVSGQQFVPDRGLLQRPPRERELMREPLSVAADAVLPRPAPGQRVERGGRGGGWYSSRRSGQHD